MSHVCQCRNAHTDTTTHLILVCLERSRVSCRNVSQVARHVSVLLLLRRPSVTLCRRSLATLLSLRFISLRPLWTLVATVADGLARLIWVLAIGSPCVSLDVLFVGDFVLVGALPMGCLTSRWIICATIQIPRATRRMSRIEQLFSLQGLADQRNVFPVKCGDHSGSHVLLHSGISNPSDVAREGIDVIFREGVTQRICFVPCLLYHASTHGLHIHRPCRFHGPVIRHRFSCQIRCVFRFSRLFVASPSHGGNCCRDGFWLHWQCVMVRATLRELRLALFW